MHSLILVMKNLLIYIFTFWSFVAFSQQGRNCGTQNRLDFFKTQHPESIINQSDLELQIQKWIKDNPSVKSICHYHSGGGARSLQKQCREYLRCSNSNTN